MVAKEFDILVSGATGYTGRLVAGHFVREYSGKSDAPDWAMTGRSTTASRPKKTEPQPVRSVG